MIKNTFCFLPKIQRKKEQSIWKQGITNWNDFLKNDVKGISKRMKPFYDKKILEAKKALYENDSSYFFGKLPNTENWRLYDFFKEEAIFLDIESSGSTLDSYLTVIGLFDGINTKTMIRNVNLDVVSLKKELQKYKLLITFNGSSFDLPFLEKKYPNLLPKIPHIDLRHLCAKICLTGGLKEIEEKIGIKRTNLIVERMYGGDPLKLWRMFKGSGDDYYLKLLVEYNEEDVISLKKICEYSVLKIKEQYSGHITKLK